MSIEKETRLNKVAKELSVGVATIVDFLMKKGYTVDNNPNSKITAKQYELLQREYASDQMAKKLSEREAEIEKVRASMTRRLNIQRMQMMDQMVILSTIVSLSPFCGLFGTVWGVMMTFVQLAAQQGKKADLGQLAPGVSGALLTTVVGLLVAIPSVFGNNIIMSVIDKTCADMDTFVDDFLASLRLERVKEQQEG